MNNSYHFLDKLKDVTVEEEEAMVSFDGTALFTSTDLNLAKKITKNLLQEHYPDKPLGTNNL